jgi:hypothetical protein
LHLLRSSGVRSLSVLEAGVVAGLALWFSRGALDLVDAGGRSVRVAMLPGWPAMAGLIALAVLLCGLFALWIRVQLRRRGPTPLSRDVERQALVPLFAAALLALPYVPWLPDRVPVLQLLAGPARIWLWAIICVQVAVTAWPAIMATLRVGPFLVFLATAACGWLAASHLIASPVFPGGDEPHYLVMAQSLWRDGDLDIENNHRRGDYAEYFGSPLEPHFQKRGADGRIYSIHPVGLPVIAAPAYAVAGYRGVVALLILISSLAASLMWRLARDLVGAGPATFAWAAIALSAPYLLNSISVYPEIAGALCVAVALTAAWSRSAGIATRIAQALAIAALPWLSTKYAPMAVALLAVGVARILRPGPKAGTIDREGWSPASAAAVLVVPFALSIGAWLWFFYAFWGSPLPSAPYGASGQTSWRFLPTGVPGLLFDQEYGIVAHAPALALAFVGLAGMFRADAESRRKACEILAVFAALIVMVGAFHIWWGGDAAPGRPLASGLLLLAPPLAWAARQLQAPLARATRHLLLVVGLCITVTLVFARDGLLIANGRDGASELLRWLSPEWPLWTMAPSYINGGWIGGAGITVAWLVVAAALWWLGTRREQPGEHGLAALTVLATAFAAVVAMSLIAPPLVPARRALAERLDARARVALWDAFDATTRPLAIVYDPFRPVDPNTVPQLVTLRARAGLRRAAQPVPLLFNARFALPSGEYSIELDLDGPRPSDTDSVGLQVGRIGHPIDVWPVDDAGRGRWRHTFRLPLDAEFIGFRVSRSLEPRVRELRLHASRVDDEHSRRHAAPVLAAARYEGVSVYFHDEAVWPEARGFWTRGETTARMTVATEPRAAVPLKLRSGARPNTVKLETPTWSREVWLRPEGAVELSVPPDRRPGIIPLQVTASGGFRPNALEPGNTDSRLLGCWIEVHPPRATSGD